MQIVCDISNFGHSHHTISLLFSFLTMLLDTNTPVLYFWSVFPEDKDRKCTSAFIC